MDRFNIISFGKRIKNLETAIAQETIGSALSTFKENVSENSLIFLHCNAMVWGTARTVGSYFYSEENLWEDKVYPHRFKISNIQLLKNPIPLSDGIINKAFRESFGSGWAYRFIFTPKPLPAEIAQLIMDSVFQNCSVISRNEQTVEQRAVL